MTRFLEGAVAYAMVTAYFAIQFALVGLAFGVVYRRGARKVVTDGL